MVRVLLASPLGFLIGASLGAVGGGGSILAVPALVYAAGVTPRAATSGSLVIVGVAALAGLPAQLRAGRVRVAAGVVFALAGIAGSFVGTHVNEGIDPDALLLAFAGLMLVAAIGMVLRMRKAAALVEVVEVVEVVGTGSGPAEAGPPSGGVTLQTGPARRIRVDVGTVSRVVGAGTVVGFLTGLFGVGGGFVIVPALVLALGFAMPEAAGTSLLVIGLNAAIALAQRYDAHAVPWDAVLAFGIAAVPGVVVGARLSRVVDPARLTHWFVALLVGVAAYTAIRSGLALLG